VAIINALPFLGKKKVADFRIRQFFGLTVAMARFVAHCATIRRKDSLYNWTQNSRSLAIYGDPSIPSPQAE